MDREHNQRFVFELSENETGYTFGCDVESSMSKANSDLCALDLKWEETLTSIRNLTPDCDKLDYALAASSGVLCGLVDMFLVATPGATPLGDVTDKWFADKTIQFAKLCKWDGKIDERDELHSAIKHLEEYFKVPYDHTSAGPGLNKIYNITTENHHFKSLAHNPTLCGLYYSILDQFSVGKSLDNSHFVSQGELFIHEYDGKFVLEGSNLPSKFFSAFANWIGHLISDNSGSHSSKGRGMGIPSPLWTWMNDVVVIRDKLGLKSTEFEKHFNDFACKLFEKGYDARFQTAQAIPVFINELVVVD